MYLCRLAENDVEEGPTSDITNVAFTDQSTPTEQNLPQRYSLAIRSNPVTTTTIQTASSSSVVAKPEMISTEPITLSVLSADIDDIVQHAFDTWKNETIPINHNDTLAFTNEEDFLLADLLQRTENDQQNILLRSLGNERQLSQSSVRFFSVDNQQNMSSLFRPITQNNPTEPVAASGKYNFDNSLNKIFH